ncbi:MAG: F0F1 ATP synthase subunit epsilon [Gammaproteobacteria bacterium]|jgi:F-type H+-transporting ATPase subunit epsilon|nr:F0F1 ATP synthase subunit epsilon [Gammaproteobacteria bacterium]
MKAFTLILQDATRTERIEQVTSFTGEDASGSFGILASHARMMTSLVFGLARFRVGENHWQYLALPGAVLYFNDNELSLSTRRYLLDDNYERISIALHEQLLAEEKELHELKKSLHHMEEEVLKRLWEMGHNSGRGG